MSIFSLRRFVCNIQEFIKCFLRHNFVTIVVNACQCVSCKPDGMKLSSLEHEILINIQLGVICVDTVDVTIAST